jgi:hypothetical protein
MLKRFLILFCLAALMISCQPTETPEMTDAERQEIADIIKQKNQEILALNESMDEEAFDKMMDSWLDTDDESWLGNPGAFVQGIRIIPTLEAMEKFFRPMTKSRSSTNFMVNKDYISVMSKNHAVYVVEGKYSITNLEGETGPEYPWTSTAVWVNKNGEWKTLHYHQSWSNTPIETEEKEEE